MVRLTKVLFLTISLFIYPACFNAEESDQKQFQKTIDFTENKIQKMIKKQHLPGLVISLIDDQEIVLQKVYGQADIENAIDVSHETSFKIYSVAKSFTAIEIFREIEEGLIELDSPVSKYLPEFSIRSRYKDQKQITIRNILAHRSGLPRNECVSISEVGIDPNRLEKFEESTSDCFTCFPVEFRYKYSNLGYDLLGRVIEQIRRESFTTYMDKHILNEIGMTSSSFSSPANTTPNNIAKGYEYYKKEYYPIDQSSNISSVPSGNLYTTIGDLSVFLQAIFKNNDLFQNTKTLSLMFQDHYSYKLDPETMGLGWKTSIILGSELLVWHDGGPSDGTGALIAYLPEKKLGLAIVSNSTAFSGSITVPLAVEILEQMIKEKFDIDFEIQKNKKRIKLDKKFAEKYEGKYVTFGQIMDVQKKNNKLKGRISGIGLDLLPISNTEFKVSHWMHRIGLTKIFKPPIDFDKLKIEFLSCDKPDSCIMVINFDNISYEVSPRYPGMDSIPKFWKKLTGEYRMADRLSANNAGNISERYFSINMIDNVLVMSGPFGPILPIDEDYIIITGGPFAGEIIEYIVESGNIVHQNAVFIPIDQTE